jgi:predicted ABC-type ATPase
MGCNGHPSGLGFTSTRMKWRKRFAIPGFLPLEPYELATSTEEIRRYFASSPFLQSRQLHIAARGIEIHTGAIDFRCLEMNSYYASVLADFIRRMALASSKSFSFETVMSARDKVDLLQEAQGRGFRTYLYYIATEDPAINIQRVKNRVAEGGHDVPEEKIVSRYHRSLGLLRDAIWHSHRAFLFDTSEDQPWYFAEAEDGTSIELKSDEMPNWFQPIWDQF